MQERQFEVLGEASDYAPEIVAVKYTNVELTSPLPYRPDGEWDPNKVGHRRIPTLTEDEQEQESLHRASVPRTILVLSGGRASAVRRNAVSGGPKCASQRD